MLGLGINLEKKKMLKNFSAALFLFVQQRKKLSFNNLLGSGINLEKKLQLFLYTEFPHPGGTTLRNIAESETEI